MGNGSYRCERCNMEMDKFNWRPILSFNVADATDNQWVQCFQEEAEKIVGMSSQELGALQEENPEMYNKAFQVTIQVLTRQLEELAHVYSSTRT